jgi:hypothetical protein
MTMNASITSNSITDGQRKQIGRFLADTNDRILKEIVDGLDKDGAQKFLANGDECQKRMMATVRELSVPNEFADEEVESSYGYLSGYRPNSKSIADQVKRLQELLPGIGCANEKLAEQPIPEGAEGFFAIPRWQKVGKTYEEALQKVLDLIKQTRNGKFYNYREGKIGPDRLRLRAKTEKALETLGQQQEGNDILVIPCQFGLRHRGRSVRRGLEVMPAMEFGNDPFTIGCMLLTHPERLQHYDDLWIDCAGAEYDCGGGGAFHGAPYFCFFGDEVEFGGRFSGSANAGFGSSSGFLPQ